MRSSLFATQPALACAILTPCTLHCPLRQALRALQSLDISENPLSDLSALSALPLLSTIIASGCRLATAAQLQPLETLPNLISLVVSKNRLNGPDVIPFITSSLPKLSFLKLEGNECVSALPHYRKVILAAMPALNYFDDAPVREKDRRLAAAFCSGGFDAERAEREAIRSEETAQARERATSAQAPLPIVSFRPSRRMSQIPTSVE